MQETINAAQRSDGSTCSSNHSDAMSVRTVESDTQGTQQVFGSPEKKIQKSATKKQTSRPKGQLLFDDDSTKDKPPDPPNPNPPGNDPSQQAESG